jgi:hypothetical protein
VTVLTAQLLLYHKELQVHTLSGSSNSFYQNGRCGARLVVASSIVVHTWSTKQECCRH